MIPAFDGGILVQISGEVIRQSSELLPEHELIRLLLPKQACEERRRIFQQTWDFLQDQVAENGSEYVLKGKNPDCHFPVSVVLCMVYSKGLVKVEGDVYAP